MPMAARHVRRRPLPVLLIGMLAGRARALHLPAHRLVTRRLLAPSGRVLCSRAAAPQSAAIDATPSRRSAPGLRAPASDSLRLLNTLTGKPDLFEPIDPACVKWYTCGPTVYDAAHLGHARNYVGFDIVRRVLTDYFGYMLLYVMNITDIDDKIILRTHRNHLQVRGDWRARVQEGPHAHRMNPPSPSAPRPWPRRCCGPPQRPTTPPPPPPCAPPPPPPPKLCRPPNRRCGSWSAHRKACGRPRRAQG